MTKSDNPDVLINIFTKRKESVKQFNAGWGWLGMGMESLHVGNSTIATSNTEEPFY
jgi:hypothetical protein